MKKLLLLLLITVSLQSKAQNTITIPNIFSIKYLSINGVVKKVVEPQIKEPIELDKIHRKVRRSNDTLYIYTTADKLKYAGRIYEF